MVFEFAAVRVWAGRHCKAGPPIWLLIRRSLEETPEIKHYISNGEGETSRKVLARVACCPHRIEEFFEATKSYLGMVQYETRSCVGWHHHMIRPGGGSVEASFSCGCRTNQLGVSLIHFGCIDASVQGSLTGSDTALDS